jgi:hypothetical protein
MKQFFRKILGLEKLDQAKAQALAEAAVAQKLADQKIKEAAEATEAAAQAKLTPKERATAKGEPWVAVLDTHVNQENIRNGFFELDWNEFFIAELKKAGYGFDGDPEEEIVDRWFRDLAANMLVEAGQDPSRHGAGFINVNRINPNQSEVS